MTREGPSNILLSASDIQRNQKILMKFHPDVMIRTTQRQSKILKKTSDSPFQR